MNLENLILIFYVTTSALAIPIAMSKYENVKISRQKKLILGFIECSGWILCYSFINGLASVFLFCSLESCRGQGGAFAAWLPFILFVTALPLGIVLSLIGWFIRNNIEPDK